MLAVLTPLHGIVMQLCAFARLGNAQLRIKSSGDELNADNAVGADWGGEEGINTAIRKLKAEIAQLQNPHDPASVRKLLKEERLLRTVI